MSEKISLDSSVKIILFMTSDLFNSFTKASYNY